MTATQSVAPNDISSTRWQLWCQEYVGKLYSEEEGVSPPSLIGLKAGLEGNTQFPPLMKQMNNSGVIMMDDVCSHFNAATKQVLVNYELKYYKN